MQLRKTVLCLYRIFLKDTELRKLSTRVSKRIWAAEDPPALRTCFPKLKDALAAAFACCMVSGDSSKERLSDEDQARMPAVKLLQKPVRPRCGWSGVKALFE